MKKFIYNMLILNEPISNQELELLGEKGWQMCGVTRDDNQVVNTKYRYYFIKEINE